MLSCAICNKQLDVAIYKLGDYPICRKCHDSLKNAEPEVFKRETTGIYHYFKNFGDHWMEVVV